MFKNKFLLPAIPYWIWAILEFILFMMASLVFVVWADSSGRDWLLLLACLPPLLLIVPLGIIIVYTGQVRLWGFRRIMWLALLIIILYGIKSLPGYPLQITALSEIGSLTSATLMVLLVSYGLSLGAFMHFIVRSFPKKWSTLVRMV